jgi:peptidoglycan hydrolase CwlO-like protein
MNKPTLYAIIAGSILILIAIIFNFFSEKPNEIAKIYSEISQIESETLELIKARDIAQAEINAKNIKIKENEERAKKLKEDVGKKLYNIEPSPTQSPIPGVPPVPPVQEAQPAQSIAPL